MKSSAYWVCTIYQTWRQMFYQHNFVAFFKQPQKVGVEVHLLKMREWRPKEVESCLKVTCLVRVVMKISIRYMYFSSLCFSPLHTTISMHKMMSDSQKATVQFRVQTRTRNPCSWSLSLIQISCLSFWVPAPPSYTLLMIQSRRRKLYL